MRSESVQAKFLKCVIVQFRFVSFPGQANLLTRHTRETTRTRCGPVLRQQMSFALVVHTAVRGDYALAQLDPEDLQRPCQEAGLLKELKNIFFGCAKTNLTPNGSVIEAEYPRDAKPNSTLSRFIQEGGFYRVFSPQEVCTEKYVSKLQSRVAQLMETSKKQEARVALLTEESKKQEVRVALLMKAPEKQAIELKEVRRNLVESESARLAATSQVDALQQQVKRLQDQLLEAEELERRVNEGAGTRIQDECDEMVASVEEMVNAKRKQAFDDLVAANHHIAATMAQLRQKHASELEQLRQNHTSQMEQFDSDFKAKMAEWLEQSERDLEKVQQQMSASVRNLVHDKMQELKDRLKKKVLETP